MAVKLSKDSFKDVSTIPNAIKYLIYFLVIAFVVVLAYFLLFAKQLTALETAERQEETLRETYQTDVIKVAGLEDLKKELDEIKVSFAALLKQLPSTRDTSNVIQEIHQAVATNGVTSNSIKPGAPVIDGPVEILPYSFEIQGEYDQVLRFMTDVGKLSRLITVSDITLIPDANGQFKLTGIANTFRSLDEDQADAGEK